MFSTSKKLLVRAEIQTHDLLSPALSNAFSRKCISVQCTVVKAITLISKKIGFQSHTSPRLTQVDVGYENSVSRLLCQATNKPLATRKIDSLTLK